MRNATETYLELGQRVPTYLDGEIQIAWVLEQGLVDMAFIQRTFGVDQIMREQYISRGPRFHIAFDANAAELVFDNNKPRQGAELKRKGSEKYTNFTQNDFVGNGIRAAKGRYELIRCKPDSVSLGIMPGRRVAAVRWEGVSEGIRFFDSSVQEFKAARLNPGGNGNFELSLITNENGTRTDVTGVNGNIS